MFIVSPFKADWEGPRGLIHPSLLLLAESLIESIGHPLFRFVVAAKQRSESVSNHAPYKLLKRGIGNRLEWKPQPSKIVHRQHDLEEQALAERRAEVRAVAARCAENSDALFGG